MSNGIVLINQQNVMAGNITPGDTPGFPVKISVPGSYRLSSNLSVQSQTSIQAIVITTDDVTLDLNGFVIYGPGVEAPGGGISATDRKNIAVVNGTIKNMNSLSLGSNCRVENLRLTHILNGIQIGSYGLVKNCTIEAVDTGIFAQECCIATGNLIQAYELVMKVGQGSIVTGNTLYRSGANGNNLVASGSIINGNMVTGVKNNIHDQHVVGINADKGSMVINNKVSNASIGLNLSNDTGYADNILTENNTHVSGGIRMGINICGTTPCP